QRMQELVMCRCGTVWQLMDPSGANEPRAVGEVLARALNFIVLCFNGCGDFPGREAVTGNARRLQGSPFGSTQLFELSTQQLLERFRYSHRRLARWIGQLPSVSHPSDQAPLHQILDDCHHEEGIATGIVVDEADQLLTYIAVGELRGEKFANVGFR